MSRAEGEVAEEELLGRVLDTLLREDAYQLRSRARTVRRTDGDWLRIALREGGTVLLPVEPEGFQCEIRARRPVRLECETPPPAGTPGPGPARAEPGPDRADGATGEGRAAPPVAGSPDGAPVGSGQFATPGPAGAAADGADAGNRSSGPVRVDGGHAAVSGAVEGRPGAGGCEPRPVGRARAGRRVRPGRARTASTALPARAARRRAGPRAPGASLPAPGTSRGGPVRPGLRAADRRNPSRRVPAVRTVPSPNQGRAVRKWAPRRSPGAGSPAPSPPALGGPTGGRPWMAVASPGGRTVPGRAPSWRARAGRRVRRTGPGPCRWWPRGCRGAPGVRRRGSGRRASGA